MQGAMIPHGFDCRAFASMVSAMMAQRSAPRGDHIDIQYFRPPTGTVGDRFALEMQGHRSEVAPDVANGITGRTGSFVRASSDVSSQSQASPASRVAGGGGMSPTAGGAAAEVSPTTGVAPGGAAAEVSPTTGVAPQRIGGVESKPIADMEAEMRHALEQREKEATLLKQDKAQKESAKAAKKQEKLHKLAVAQADAPHT